MATMVTAIKDFGKLLEGVPRGAWVAISHDESRVVAYSADMNEAIQKAKSLGEDQPILLRIPESAVAFLF